MTTEAPSVADLTKSGGGDTRWGVRVVMGANTWYNNAGGVAYINSFSWNSDTPVFVFNESEVGVVEAASHEVGHALGLYHDGRDSPSEEYYEGHGSGPTSWAPIMGVGYYVSLTQWSRGEYPSASNSQDDLSIITNATNGFGYRADDHAGDISGATPLVSEDGELVLTSGIIERNTDVDYFVFQTGGGAIDIDIDPFYLAPNLDILATLYDNDGELILESNPVSLLSATISTTLTAGTYYLSIDGTGRTANGPAGPDYGYTDYGSLGYYSITGSVGQEVVPIVTVDVLATNDQTPALSGGVSDPEATITIDVGSQLGFLAINNGDGTWTLPDDYLSALAEGVYDVIVRAESVAGLVGFDETTAELTIDLTAPVVTIDPLTSSTKSPALTGTVDDPSAVIRVSVGGQNNLAAVNNSDGTWTLPADTIAPLANGVYDVQVSATDIAQNTGADATSDELTVNAPPTVTVNTLLTADSTPDIAGTVDDPAATILVSVNGQSGLAATNNGDGTWTLPGSSLAALPNGVYEVTATATSAGSLTGNDSTSQELWVQLSGGLFTVTNGQGVDLPGKGSSGAASLYPSGIDVSGMTGPMNKVRVTVNDLSHAYPDDIDLFLVGPGGETVMLLSDAGGSGDIEGIDLTFDDAASALATNAGLLSSGIYRPTNYGASDAFAGPAPMGPYGSQLSVFTGKSPNGTWRLFAMDDAEGDVGEIAGSWMLSFEIGVDVTAPIVTIDSLITSDATPTLTGTVDDPTATVVVFIPTPSGQSVYFATNNGDGTWTLDGDELAALPAKVYDVSVIGSDIRGNFRYDTTVDELEIQAFTPQNLYSNTDAITLPGTGTVGVGGPYPSVINVAEITDTVIDVNVTLHGLSHTYTDDLDILLVAPSGQTVILMSDAGGNYSVSDLTLVFDDSSLLELSDSDELVSGAYRPTDYMVGDSLPAPAPTRPYGRTLSLLNGLNPNGDWRLYTYDDNSGDSGVIAGGWSIEFELQNSDDHGNSYGVATDVAAPAVIQGALENLGDADYFSFTAVAGMEYVFATELGTLLDSTLTLYGKDGVSFLIQNDDKGGEYASQIDWVAPSNGEYFLAVRGYGNALTGSYSLRIESELDDFGNASDVARPVATPSSTVGVIEEESDADYFAFSTVKGGIYRLDATLVSLFDSTLTLYDTDGSTELDFNDDVEFSLDSSIMWTATDSGVYYAAVRSYQQSSMGEYLFSVSANLSPGDFNGDLVVNAADYSVYRDTLGQTVALPFAGADGDGDGMVTEADYAIWRSYYGASYPSGGAAEEAGPPISGLPYVKAPLVAVSAPVAREAYAAGLRETLTDHDAAFFDYPAPVVPGPAPAIPGLSVTAQYEPDATPRLSTEREDALRWLAAMQIALSPSIGDAEVDKTVSDDARDSKSEEVDPTPPRIVRMSRAVTSAF